MGLRWFNVLEPSRRQDSYGFGLSSAPCFRKCLLVMDHGDPSARMRSHRSEVTQPKRHRRDQTALRRLDVGCK